MKLMHSMLTSIAASVLAATLFLPTETAAFAIKEISAVKAYSIANSHAAKPLLNLIAETPSDAEKDAFNSAKELGTPDAWNAFLKAYPSGFHADLARAYLKKMGEGEQPSAQATNPVAKPDAKVTAKTAIRVQYDGGEFVKTGPGKWVETKNTGSIQIALEEVSASRQEIYLYQPSNQITLVLDFERKVILQSGEGEAGRRKIHDITAAFGDPAATAAQPSRDIQPERPERLETYKPQPREERDAREPASQDRREEIDRAQREQDEEFQRLLREAHERRRASGQGVTQRRRVETYRKAKGCEEGFYLANGRCKRRPASRPGGCPPGTVPVPETDNCVKANQQPEFELRPWTKPGCKTWQSQCAQGNNAACAKYETTCQVN